MSFSPISPAEVRGLWARLRRDEPHLLSNFEDFLARVTFQIIDANQEKQEMESALKRSAGPLLYTVKGQSVTFLRSLLVHLAEHVCPSFSRLLLSDFYRFEV